MKTKQVTSLVQQAQKLTAKGVLNDRQISHLAKKHGMIAPFVDHKVDGEGMASYGLEPHGYTIRLGDKYKIPQLPDDFIEDYTSPSDVLSYFHRMMTGRFLDSDYVSLKNGYDYIDGKLKEKDGKMHVVVPPWNSVLAISLESFDIPDDIAPTCWSKSTWARLHSFANITPLEAGWVGDRLTIEITNLSVRPLLLPVGEGIAQIRFYRGDAASEKYGGRYQNQKGVPQQAIP